ncbi:tautomerase family protein [Populibacterium corticicola]|uniref:Tautomerase family protein n=1 Tax=Populibacterium corticicola TaxID=1812826 RepID=A0ABW5XEI4_9MICO
MPHVRVDLDEKFRTRIPEIGDALHLSLVQGLNMEDDDLFQIFTVHQPGEIRFSPTYPGAQRSELILIQILASFGYTPDDKRAFYKRVVDNMVSLGFAQDELLVSIIEIDGENNWHAPEHSVTE